jgi:MFS family permease
MHRNIKLLAVFNFFTDLKFHSAVLILYFASITGSFTLSMSLFSIVMISSAIFEIPTGTFSDIIGRKKSATAGALFAVSSAIFYAIGQNYWILFLGALLEGISRSWYSGNNDALLHDSLSELKNKGSYAHYLGKVSAMFQVALMVGAVIGSILAQWSFSLIMWLSVIPQIVCFVISLFLTEPNRLKKGEANIFSHIKISALHLWNNKKLKLLSIQDIISFGIGESSFQFGSAFIATLWPLWAIGFSKMISYGGASVSYWFSGKIIRKFGEYNILIAAHIYTRIANFIAYGAPTVFSPILMASSSIFYGVTSVSKNSLMQKEYTEEQRATLGSIHSFIGSLFFGMFAPILGFIPDMYGPAKALLFVQCCMLSVLYINVKLKKMKEGHT